MSLLLLLTTLALLSSVSLAVPPAQPPPNGKFHGFLNSLNNGEPDPTGDWLISTLCFCHLPARNSDDLEHDYRYEKAHIFQHEYYNFHSNATFVMDHMCLAKAHYQGDICVHPNVEGDNNDWLRDHKYSCKRFQRTDEEKIRQVHSKRSTRREPRGGPHLNTHQICWGIIHPCDPGPFTHYPDNKSKSPEQDTVCFATDTDFYGMDEMEIKFNRQKRIMRKNGDQGRVSTDFDEVQEICQNMCLDRFNMPADMLINDERADGGSRQYVYTDVDDMCDNCK